MRRLFIFRAASILGLGLFLLAEPAAAVIESPLPLKRILKDTQFIFTAKVESFDKEKGLAVFTVQDNLKGKVPFKQMSLPLPPDKEGLRENNRPSFLVKRLAADLPVVWFADFGRSPAFDKVREEGMTLFLYTNGTWAQLAGNAKPGGEDTKIVIRFHHYEPFLRRTFKGTTAEMRQVIIDGLAGTKEPPPYDPKEPAGLGPEVKP
ncbi:hypothetical protein AYO44_14370 [Planctomycetaceae bacterium SCGC AG-212-F19]|nr:hypothetical protein AYO44_14370 [Planctomycetaceae bacterium SCGC AG-212-F19]